MADDYTDVATILENYKPSNHEFFEKGLNRVKENKLPIEDFANSLKHVPKAKKPKT